MRKANQTSFKQGHQHAKAVLLKISKKVKGRVFPHMQQSLSKAAREKISKTLKARGIKPIKPYQTQGPLSIAHRKKIANAHKGDRSNFWKGGVSKAYRVIRGSVEYSAWREQVFTRDNYTCVFCKKRGHKLNADHIKPFAYYPALRFSVANGRTLCVGCHKKTDTYLNKAKTWHLSVKP